jgi:peptidoglycan/LPS O-acetylase OafA/YrhL
MQAVDVRDEPRGVDGDTSLAEVPDAEPGSATGPAPVARPGRPAEIRALTGIRAIAALWVLSFHYRPLLLAAFPFLWPVLPVMDVGYLGVDLFFCLSGLILTYTHLDRMVDGWGPRKMWGFLWLRLSRIWPVTAVMMIVWGVLTVVVELTMRSNFGFGQLNAGRFLAHLALIQAWFDDTRDWNGVDWSLSAEWMAYLLFTVLVVALGKFRAQLSSRALVTLAFLSVLPIVAVGFTFDDGTDLTFYAGKVMPGIVALRVLGEFVGGALVALLLMRRGMGSKAPWYLRPTLVGAVMIGTIFLFTRYDPNRRLRDGKEWLTGSGHSFWGHTESVALIPMFLVLLAGLALASRLDPVRWLLSTRLLVWGGRVSFSLYLVHWTYLNLLEALYQYFAVEASLTYTLMLVGTILSAIGTAWLLYRFVEEPSRRAMRRMLPSSMAV